MSRAKAPLARIERSEPIRMTVDGATWTGNWDAVRWTDLVFCGDALCELFAQILGVETNQIFSEKFERFDNDQVWIGVRISLNNEATIKITTELRETLDAAALSFFDKISYQRDLFVSAVPACHAHIESISDNVSNTFRQQYGGKHISTPLQIVGFQQTTICSGSYRAKPDILPTSPKNKKIIGIADGIRFSTKTLTVISSKCEHNILFDPQFFFEVLVELVKNQTIIVFNVLEKSDAKGLLVFTLHGIGREIETHDKLI